MSGSDANFHPIQEKGSNLYSDLYSDSDSDVDSDSDIHLPAPLDLFDHNNPKHAEIEKLNRCIRDFSLLEAKETLALLTNKTVEDLHVSYSTKCSCGCYNTNCIFDAFESVDIGSLRYIVETNILHPAVLCAILNKLFNMSGAITRNDDTESKITVIAKAYKNQESNVDPCIEYLIDNLCEKHPKLAAEWRNTPAKTEESFTTETLLHSVFFGYTSDTKVEKWARKLLYVGCDPFAPYNTKANLTDTPFIYMLQELHCTLALETYLACEPEELKKIVNHTNQLGRNILMRILIRYTTPIKKQQKTIMESLRIITKLLFQIGLDTKHKDNDGWAIIDYMKQYGFDELSE